MANANSIRNVVRTSVVREEGVTLNADKESRIIFCQFSADVQYGIALRPS